jgi:HD superfamily phosphohydrolase
VPKWGLTEPQRRAAPWGLSYEYLGPSKVITDPIHGDVYLTELEQIFIDTEPFQRLRRIKQLGNTHLVYPGATHSRFAHSLGSVRVAQDLVDAVIDQQNTPRHVPDLFQEWDEARRGAFETIVARSNLAEPVSESEATTLVQSFTEVDRKVGEAVVSARLGALLHDLCHVPFGHSIEDELKILKPHDENLQRFDRLWKRLRLPQQLEEQLWQGGLLKELRRLILSKKVDPHELRYPFVEDIVGNTICADLLDYLERDHRATGLPVALGRRFVSSFYVTPTGDPETGNHMVLRIGRGGRERTDVVTEVLKYLRYRYELSERALVHHAKLGADAMVGKALEMWYDLLWLEKARAALERRHTQTSKTATRYRTPAWLGDQNIGTVREKFSEIQGAAALKRVNTEARQQLDIELSAHGDDALLERLAELPHLIGPPARTEAVRRLARALLDRHLFKPVASQRNPPRGAKEMVKKLGSPDDRRRFEEDAAQWAGLDHRWQVLLWVPPELMRLKIADVLVDDGEAIMTFFQYEERGKRRGSDIYEAHKALWEIAVYLDPEYARGDAGRLARRKVVARLAQRLNITFTQYEPTLGKRAYQWPERLAAREAVNLVRQDPELADEQPNLVEDLFKAAHGQQVQARGRQQDESWDALFARYRETEEARVASA